MNPGKDLNSFIVGYAREYTMTSIANRIRHSHISRDIFNSNVHVWQYALFIRNDTVARRGILYESW